MNAVQSKPEGGAATGIALNLNAAGIGLKNTVYDGKP
jgi:hypothetical protein